MPGPLGTIAPTTDPNWAWDVPGWTNQGNTGDTEGAGLSAPSNPLAPSGAILSGVVASTMDAGSAAVAGLVAATNVAYAALVYVPAPAVTKKAFASGAGSATATNGYYFLSSVGGTVLAATASQGASALTGALSWATPYTLSSGFYYLGLAGAAATVGTFVGCPVSGVTAGNGAGLVWAASGPYPRFVTVATVLTAAAPTSFTWAAQTTPGSAYMSMF